MSTKEVFTDIYAKNRWGGEPGEFYSGPGSDAEVAKPYIDAVRTFIEQHSIKTVLDIGCGDFRIGKAISSSSNVDYTGMDIVEPLIARNKTLFEGANVRFLAGNVVEDDLPDADLCMVREVFQHLSNQQIGRALAKMSKFPYVIITDHQPSAEVGFIPNRDKPHGQNIRLYDNSALALDKPPFGLKNVTVLLDALSPNIIFDKNERLRSFLITNEVSRPRAHRQEGAVVAGEA